MHNTLQPVTMREASYWRPTSPAQWAYAAGTAILAAGLLAVAAPGVPSERLGLWVVALAGLAFAAGGLIESSSTTVGGAFAALVAGVYLISSAVHRTASHPTLLAQLAVFSGAVLLVGAVMKRRRAAR